MKLQSLLALLLIMLLGACASAKTGGPALPSDAAERDRVVTILGQMLNGPENPRDTAVVHWTGTLRIAIVGRNERAQQALFDQGIAPFMRDFNAITGLRFERVSPEEANVLVIMAEDVGALRRDYEPLMDRFLVDPRYTQAFEAVVNRLGGRCAYASIDRDFVYQSAIVFAAPDVTDQHFAECAATSMAGVVGLQGQLDGPGSIKSKGDHRVRPTGLDLKALKILYGGTRGQRLRDIPALQDSI